MSCRGCGSRAVLLVLGGSAVGIAMVSLLGEAGCGLAVVAMLVAWGLSRGLGRHSRSGGHSRGSFENGDHWQGHEDW
jgi:hypothetical protein